MCIQYDLQHMDLISEMQRLVQFRGRRKYHEDREKNWDAVQDERSGNNKAWEGKDNRRALQQKAVSTWRMRVTVFLSLTQNFM